MTTDGVNTVSKIYPKMFWRFCAILTAVCPKGKSGFLNINNSCNDILILYSSSGAHQSSLSNASAGSFSAMPTVALSREEDDEIDRFIAPPLWVSH